MSDSLFTIEDLSSPAIMAIAQRLGGMVMSIIMAVEIATPDGERHSIAIWDHESSAALQLGLDRVLTMVMEARAQSLCEVAYEEEDDE